VVTYHLVLPQSAAGDLAVAPASDAWGPVRHENFMEPAELQATEPLEPPRNQQTSEAETLAGPSFQLPFPGSRPESRPSSRQTTVADVIEHTSGPPSTRQLPPFERLGITSMPRPPSTASSDAYPSGRSGFLSVGSARWGAGLDFYGYSRHALVCLSDLSRYNYRDASDQTVP
jgi:hypothetical protein